MHQGFFVLRFVCLLWLQSPGGFAQYKTTYVKTGRLPYQAGNFAKNALRSYNSWSRINSLALSYTKNMNQWDHVTRSRFYDEFDGADNDWDTFPGDQSPTWPPDYDTWPQTATQAPLPLQSQVPQQVIPQSTYQVPYQVPTTAPTRVWSPVAQPIPAPAQLPTWPSQIAPQKTAQLHTGAGVVSREALRICSPGPPLGVNPLFRNCLIIGDSISLGQGTQTRSLELAFGAARNHKLVVLAKKGTLYLGTVKRELKGLCQVQHAPFAKGSGAVDSRYGLRCLSLMLRTTALEPTTYDAIVFNFGMHDINYSNRFPEEFVPLDEYRENLSKIKEILLDTGARLAFSLTTPVPSSGRRNEKVVSYNQEARRIMASGKSVEIVDLHATVISNCGEPPYQMCSIMRGPKDVHYNSKGNQLLGEQIADTFRKLLSQAKPRGQQFPPNAPELSAREGLASFYMYDDSTICQDMVTRCPVRTTCCENLLSLTGHGCCMEPDAVKCPDSWHCCPRGSHCSPDCNFRTCKCLFPASHPALSRFGGGYRSRNPGDKTKAVTKESKSKTSASRPTGRNPPKNKHTKEKLTGQSSLKESSTPKENHGRSRKTTKEMKSKKKHRSKKKGHKINKERRRGGKRKKKTVKHLHKGKHHVSSHTKKHASHWRKTSPIQRLNSKAVLAHKTHKKTNYHPSIRQSWETRFNDTLDELKKQKLHIKFAHAWGGKKHQRLSYKLNKERNTRHKTHASMTEELGHLIVHHRNKTSEAKTRPRLPFHKKQGDRIKKIFNLLKLRQRPRKVKKLHAHLRLTFKERMHENDSRKSVFKNRFKEKTLQQAGHHGVKVDEEERKADGNPTKKPTRKHGTEKERKWKVLLRLRHRFRSDKKKWKHATFHWGNHQRRNKKNSLRNHSHRAPQNVRHRKKLRKDNKVTAVPNVLPRSNEMSLKAAKNLQGSLNFTITATSSVDVSSRNAALNISADGIRLNMKTELRNISGNDINGNKAMNVTLKLNKIQENSTERLTSNANMVNTTSWQEAANHSWQYESGMQSSGNLSQSAKFGPSKTLSRGALASMHNVTKPEDVGCITVEDMEAGLGSGSGYSDPEASSPQLGTEKIDMENRTVTRKTEGPISPTIKNESASVSSDTFLGDSHSGFGSAPEYTEESTSLYGGRGENGDEQELVVKNNNETQRLKNSVNAKKTKASDLCDEWLADCHSGSGSGNGYTEESASHFVSENENKHKLFVKNATELQSIRSPAKGKKNRASGVRTESDNFTVNGQFGSGSADDSIEGISLHSEGKNEDRPEVFVKNATEKQSLKNLANSKNVTSVGTVSDNFVLNSQSGSGSAEDSMEGISSHSEGKHATKHELLVTNDTETQRLRNLANLKNAKANVRIVNDSYMENDQSDSGSEVDSMKASASNLEGKDKDNHELFIKNDTKTQTFKCPASSHKSKASTRIMSEGFMESEQSGSGFASGSEASSHEEENESGNVFEEMISSQEFGSAATVGNHEDPKETPLTNSRLVRYWKHLSIEENPQKSPGLDLASGNTPATNAEGTDIGHEASAAESLTSPSSRIKGEGDAYKDNKNYENEKIDVDQEEENENPKTSVVNGLIPSSGAKELPSSLVTEAKAYIQNLSRNAVSNRSSESSVYAVSNQNNDWNSLKETYSGDGRELNESQSSETGSGEFLGQLGVPRPKGITSQVGSIERGSSVLTQGHYDKSIHKERGRGNSYNLGARGQNLGSEDLKGGSGKLNFLDDTKKVYERRREMGKLATNQQGNRSSWIDKELQQLLYYLSTTKQTRNGSGSQDTGSKRQDTKTLWTSPDKNPKSFDSASYPQISSKSKLVYSRVEDRPLQTWMSNAKDDKLRSKNFLKIKANAHLQNAQSTSTELGLLKSSKIGPSHLYPFQMYRSDIALQRTDDEHSRLVSSGSKLGSQAEFKHSSLTPMVRGIGSRLLGKEQINLWQQGTPQFVGEGSGGDENGLFFDS